MLAYPKPGSVHPLQFEGIVTEAEFARTAKEFALAQAIAAAAGRKIQSCVTALQRFTQRSVKRLGRFGRNGPAQTDALLI